MDRLPASEELLAPETQTLAILLSTTCCNSFDVNCLKSLDGLKGELQSWFMERENLQKLDASSGHEPRCKGSK